MHQIQQMLTARDQLVHVHIGEAGSEIGSAPIDDSKTRRDSGGDGRTNLRNAAPFYHDVLPWNSASLPHRNDCDISYHEVLRTILRRKIDQQFINAGFIGEISESPFPFYGCQRLGDQKAHENSANQQSDELEVPLH